MSHDYKNRSYKKQQYAVHSILDAVHRKNIQLDISAECESEKNEICFIRNYMFNMNENNRLYHNLC